MTRRIAIALLSSLAVAYGQKRSARQKGPDVKLLEAAARLDEKRVNIDIRVRNVSDRPIQKLTVIFEILDPSNNVLTRQQGTIDESLLEPGDEGGFHGQIAWHARTHAFRVSFEDGSGRDLRAENTGPFPVE
jgi:hypothetical protein